MTKAERAIIYIFFFLSDLSDSLGILKRSLVPHALLRRRLTYKDDWAMRKSRTGNYEH